MIPRRLLLEVPAEHLPNREISQPTDNEALTLATAEELLQNHADDVCL